MAMALMGVGIVIATPVLRMPSSPSLVWVTWATTLRLFAGTVSLSLLVLLSAKRKEYLAALKPAPVWKYCIPASILGSYLAMIFWVAGFAYANKAGRAAVLNQTTTIFAIILATVILKESFTRRKLVAVTLAVLGVLLVTGRDFLANLVSTLAR
jgi:drug/metabolite transporter (DMT)-like permease